MAIRYDSLFATRLHAHYVTETRLTLRGWHEILRAAQYIAGTRDL